MTYDAVVTVVDLAFGEPEMVSRLGITVVLDGDEVEEDAVDPVRDALDGMADDDARVAEAVDEGEADVVVRFVECLFFRHFHGNAVMVVEDVLHGFVKPGADALDLLEAAVESDEDLLRQVVGELGVAEPGVERSADHGEVVTVDAREEGVFFLEYGHGVPLVT